MLKDISCEQGIDTSFKSPFSFQIISSSTPSEVYTETEAMEDSFFWRSLDHSLSELSHEYETIYRNRVRHFISDQENQSDMFNQQNTQDQAVSTMKPRRYQDDDIPAGEAIKVVKHLATTDKSGSTPSRVVGGVNHLNLIQIKGNPVSSWQPKLVSGGNSQNVLSVVRPMLNCIQINELLIKNTDVTPTVFK